MTDTNRLNNGLIKTNGDSATRSGMSWSQEEIEFLRENYERLGYERIGEELGRSSLAVHKRARALGLSSKRRGRWSKEEDDFLREHYATLGSRRISERLGRSDRSVRVRASKLNIKSNSVCQWTKEEYDFMQEHYETRGVKYVSEQLGRSESAVYNRAHALGLKQPRPPSRSSWSTADDDFLREHYQSLTARDLGEILGRNETAVRSRVQCLGLRKNAKRSAH